MIVSRQEYLGAPVVIPLSRKHIIPILVACVAALFALQASAQLQTAKPNIILVMPDDVGYGDYACLGNPIMRTPAVDAFKKESLLLTQFHVSPTCAPTRSALMSGRHEFKNGVTHTIYERERMSLKTFTLPQMLKSVGYTTGIFGKWHLGDEAASGPRIAGLTRFTSTAAAASGRPTPVPVVMHRTIPTSTRPCGTMAN